MIPVVGVIPLVAVLQASAGRRRLAVDLRGTLGSDQMRDNRRPLATDARQGLHEAGAEQVVAASLQAGDHRACRVAAFFPHRPIARGQRSGGLGVLHFDPTTPPNVLAHSSGPGDQRSHDHAAAIGEGHGAAGDGDRPHVLDLIRLAHVAVGGRVAALQQRLDGEQVGGDLGQLEAVSLGLRPAPADDLEQLAAVAVLAQGHGTDVEQFHVGRLLAAGHLHPQTSLSRADRHACQVLRVRDVRHARVLNVGRPLALGCDQNRVLNRGKGKKLVALRWVDARARDAIEPEIARDALHRGDHRVVAHAPGGRVGHEPCVVDGEGGGSQLAGPEPPDATSPARPAVHRLQNRLHRLGVVGVRRDRDAAAVARKRDGGGAASGRRQSEDGGDVACIGRVLDVLRSDVRRVQIPAGRPPGVVVGVECGVLGPDS